MKSLPLNSDQVRAVLEKRKTMHRVVVKFQAIHGHSVFRYVHDHPDGGYQFSETDTFSDIGGKGKQPPWQVGDRLFVTDDLEVEITAIRVERLQDISHVDCLHEGATTPLRSVNALISVFINDWNTRNPKHPWAENPWVWVMTFKEVKR